MLPFVVLVGIVGFFLGWSCAEQSSFNDCLTDKHTVLADSQISCQVVSIEINGHPIIIQEKE